MEAQTDTRVRVKPENFHGTEAASHQTDHGPASVGQLPHEHVAAQEHTESMQIPSNSMPPGEAWQDFLKNGENMFSDEIIDSESVKGIFGWETVDDTSIPYILRKSKKFVSVRIVERKLLSKYPNTFPDELGKKDPLVSFFITEAEANLLNEINTAHCDFEYGHNPFTIKDLIVDLEEFEEFFKIVKKTFPADVLEKISEEPAPVMSSIVKTDLSKICGWIQINNTVSPYIIRVDNGKQVKLVPLSVIVFAAGLLTNSGVDGLLPTTEECALLNEACKTAGFNFLFGKNTRLISISEVLQRCQVQLFELPFKNPLEHARYLDPQTGLSPSNLHTAVSSNPQGATSVQHHPPTKPQGSLNHPSNHSFHSWFPPPSCHPSQVTMSSGLNNSISPGLVSNPSTLSGLHNGPSNFQKSISPSLIYPQRPYAGTTLESSYMQNVRFQSMPEKNHDNYGSVQRPVLPGSLWPLLPGGQTNVNNSMNLNMMSITPPIAPEPSNTSVYQPHSLPPNPLLHSINSSSVPDFNYPIFCSPMGMPPRSVVTQSMHKDLTPSVARYATPIMGVLPPTQQYPMSQSHPPRRKLVYGYQTTKKPLEINVMTTLPTSRQQAAVESQKPFAFATNNGHQNMTTAVPDVYSNSSNQLSSSYNNNTSKPFSSHKISACLVNGKSISCIIADLPHRKGKFCLVEAVSKLYFPTVPLSEFVKVLQVVLKINLHECSSEEEASFVQYYSLPVSKLKCNKVISVEDLELYFPQLNYMFTKCSTDENTDQQFSSNKHTAGQKHKSDYSFLGPPKKIGESKIDSSVLRYDKDIQHKGGSVPNTGNGTPIIVIDDE